MKIYTRIEHEWNGERYVLASADWAEYEGPVALCTGAEEVGAKEVASKATAETATAATAAEATATFGGFDAAALNAAAESGSLATAGGVGTVASQVATLPTAAAVVQGVKGLATVAGPVVSLASAASSVDASRKLGAAARAQSGGPTGSVLGVPAPTVFPPATMPVFGSQSLEIQRRSLTEQLQRRGRASTILTADSPTGDKLGA